MKHTRFAVLVAAVAALAAPAAHAVDSRSLSFSQAVALAGGQSPNVTLAQLRTDEAAGKVTQSRAAFLPGATATASSVDRTFNIKSLGVKFPAIPGQPGFADLQGPAYDSEARLKVTQTLLDLSSWQKLRASHLAVTGARADQASAGEAAAQSAALAYLRAARAEAVLAARAEDLRLAQELQSLAEAQLSAGTSPGIDVTRARTQVVAARGAVLVSRNQRDRSRLDLARTLGVDPATNFTLTDTLAATLGASDAPGDAAAAAAFAFEHREELHGEQARLARARADKSATAAERLPRLDVSADWGQSGEHFGDAIATRTYAVALTMPFLDGLKREGKLHEQDALVRESQVRAKDLRDQVAAEVSAALLDLSSGTEQMSVASERLALAGQEVAQARERFTSGVAGNIEVINAQTSLVRARDADIDARFAAASARIALARAAGVARNMH